MAPFADTVNAVLTRFGQWLGIKPSEAKRAEAMQQKLDEARAANEDRLQSLKERINDLERQALRKKAEFDSARGDSQRIVGREIDRLFKDIDRLRGQETILSANIDRIGLAQSKLAELVAARQQGLEEAALDDLAFDLEEAVDELKQSDRVARDLEKVRYTPEEPEPVKVDERIHEVEGERETKVELSPETQKRLKELASEEE